MDYSKVIEYLKSVEIEAEYAIPNNVDVSGIGAELKILNLEQIKSEMDECYPGIVLGKFNYCCIGMDMTGGGDYYYIKIDNISNGQIVPIYRMHHDCVINNLSDYDFKNGCRLIIDDITKLKLYRI